MRLLVITNDYPPKAGGIQQYLGNLVDAYPHDVRVLAPADGPATGARGEAVVRRDRRAWMLPSARIVSWVADQADDFGAEAILFGAPLPMPLLAKRLGRDVPIGVLCHGAEVTIPAALPGARGLLARTLRRADVCFAVSRFTLKKVEALSGREARYLGGGVDVEAFAPPWRGEPEAAQSSNPFVLGCVSRFIPRKGQERLIRAVVELRRRGHDVELLLVGRGRRERALRSLATNVGVPTRFEVDVPWAQLPDLYARMDVFCMPCRSRWGGLEVEGLGLVFLEAASVGIPVLAGTSGGAPETVVPGVTGYVVADTKDIVEAVDGLVADPRRRHEMGAAGRGRVLADFTWHTVVGRLIAGFEEIL